MNLLAKNIWLIVILLSVNCSLFSQSDKSEIPVVHYKNGVFVEDLPYERRFIVKVPVTNRGHKSNICGIIINKGWGTKDFYVAGYDWIDLKDNSITEYEILIDKGLRYKKNYTFEVVFFLEEDYSPDESIIGDIIRGCRKKFDSNGRGISGGNVEEVLEEIEQAVRTENKYVNIEIGKNNEIIQKTDVNLFKFPVVTTKGVVSSNDFARLALKQFKVDYNKEKREIELNKLSQNQSKFISYLEMVIKCDPSLKKNVLRIKSFVETKDVFKTSDNDFTTITKSKKCTKEGNVITEIFELHFNIDGLNRSISEDEISISTLEEKIGSMTGIMRLGIKSVGLATFTKEIAINSIEGLNKIRIGTSFGSSAALLNFSGLGKDGRSNIQASPFGYFALKFYLRPVDKGLENPYLSDDVLLNKMSLYLGLKAVGDLNYRGSTLSNFIGVNPVLGLSYDLTPYLSVDVGTILFSQDSVYPLVNERKPFRAALTLGISFDPDLINRFRSLITNQQYKID